VIYKDLLILWAILLNIGVYIINIAYNPLFISDTMGQSGQLYYVLNLLKVSSHLNGYILLIKSNNIKDML
jgi:hypothetical protein